MTPEATPREALYIETGLLDPETVIKKNRISMEARIINGDNQTMKQVLKLNSKDCWIEENKKLKQEIGIKDEDIINTKYHLKNTLQNKIKTNFEKVLRNNADNKSKMIYYMEGKQTWKAGNRAKYLSKLTRNQVSTIFKARTRMLKVKSNYKNGNKNLNCRLCGTSEETQKHILEECAVLNTEIPTISKEMLFQENPEELKMVITNIEKRMEKLENQSSNQSINQPNQPITTTNQ